MQWPILRRAIMISFSHGISNDIDVSSRKQNTVRNGQSPRPALSPGQTVTFGNGESRDCADSASTTSSHRYPTSLLYPTPLLSSIFTSTALFGHLSQCYRMTERSIQYLILLHSLVQY